MAIATTTQFANRYGLDVKIFDATNSSSTTPLMTIDFANVSDIDISGDRTWATGGQAHNNKVGFNDPMQGTFKLSTQIMTAQLLNLMAGGDVSSTTTTVDFKNDAITSSPKYYKITAETVWQDADGLTYSETITFHKACPKRALNISYSGDGDPVSVDVEFDLMQGADGKILTIAKADYTG